MEPTCALYFPWRMMYGEKRVLKPPGLLLDSYKHVCKIHTLPKMLLRPDRSSEEDIPHRTVCQNPGGLMWRTDDPELKAKLPQHRLHLVHYYAKSVEEFLVKLDQSIPPFFRYLPDAYDKVRHCPDFADIGYDPRYEALVREIMGQFSAGDGGRFLGPLPEYRHGAIDQHELYLFFRLRVAMRDEWDEVAYLKEYPTIAAAVEAGTWADGLQHFLEEGFMSGAKSCWVRNGSHAFCI
jgi:hypothetical protein